MEAFAAGDIDAAQAMIYNEYAQVLETKNPATGELYKAEDLNVISWEEYGTSMLQDAIFASEAWLAKAGNEDVAVKFLKASFQGWIFCRDNPAECVDIVLKSDAALPKGHQTWQLNEVNGIIWPSPNGIGITDQAAFDRTVQVAIDGKILTKPVEGTAWRNDLAEKALARARRRRHQGRVLAEGHRHPHRGRPVAVTRFDRITEADRLQRSASSFRAFVVAGLACALLIAGCGGADRPSVTPAASASRSVEPSSAAPSAPTATAVRVQLRGTIRAEFAGFIAAIDEGYYEAADLDVTLVEAAPGTDAVAAGSKSDGPEFTVAWVPAVLEQRGKGDSDLVDIGQVFQRSGTLSLSWRDAEITGPLGFRDQRVGVYPFGDGLEVLAGAIRAGLKPGTDFESVTQRADLDGPIDRDVDVAQATIYDGYARVLESKAPGGRGLYQSSDMNVINWYDEGTAMLQDAIFARPSWLAIDGNEAIAQRFLKATFQGWIHCREHADACVEATIRAGSKDVVSSGSPGGASPVPSGAAAPSASAATPAPRPTFGPGHHAWSMNEVNALIWPSPAGIGVVDDATWQHTVEVCLEAGFIPTPPPEEALRTRPRAGGTGRIGGLRHGRPLVRQEHRGDHAGRSVGGAHGAPFRRRFPLASELPGYRSADNDCPAPEFGRIGRCPRTMPRCSPAN